MSVSTTGSRNLHFVVGVCNKWLLLVLSEEKADWCNFEVLVVRGLCNKAIDLADLH